MPRLLSAVTTDPRSLRLLAASNAPDKLVRNEPVALAQSVMSVWGIAMLALVSAVVRPFASTVTTGTTVADPVGPAAPPPAAASVGFGYVPVRSPPADPVGAAPVMVTLLAAVALPLASSVTCATWVASP